ncbi:MAG TPA: carboxypeptidase regulatory-like domain-containing protein [Candidatus Acidoferrum sp.]|nr:carboxypeptidase regulatory-like domain-containing protein [Candidatus Acidoferrum sp.]
MKAFRLVFHSYGARLLSCLGTLSLFLLLPLLASAQTNGLISGTVTDKSGAAVVGAQVVIASVGGNLTRTTETNGEGVYVASSLPSGTYNIAVTAKGFQKFEAQNFVLEVAQKARVDVMLTVGTVTEEVIVTGENVAQVDTQSSEIGSTITGKQVQQLELNGRNFTQLVTLSPGVISQTGTDEGTVGIAGNTQYSINGGRTEYNNWELDGGDNMDNGSNATLNVYPNLEAIAEFKVLTSSYGAQYGKSGSGTIEVETKSGTSQFHGSAFYYGRNNFFNANSWQNSGQGIPRPSYKKHDWGYTVGGPIYKKKTFFFWSQEWRREIEPGSTIAQNVPSDAERGGNFDDVCPTYNGNAFDPSTAGYPDCPYVPGSLVSTTVGSTTTYSATPFVKNTVPTTFSTTATALLSLIPHANGTLGQYATGQAAPGPLPAYLANPSLPTHWREELIRVDHNLTDNQRLTFRWIHDTWGTINQGPLWGQYGNTFDNTNTTFTGPTTSFVTRLTSNFTPTLMNEFVASYTDDHIYLSNQSKVVGLPSGGIDLNPLFANGLGGKIPAFSVGNTAGVAYGSGGFSVDTGYFPWKNANPTYTYRDIVTKIIRTHTLIFGGYFVAAQKNQESSVDVQGQLAFAVGNPITTGNPFADLLTSQIGTYTQNEAAIYFYDRYKIFEPFFQDDWRITKKLTLNLGLRWSVFGRYQEKHDHEFNFSEASYELAKAPSLYNFNDPNYSGLLNITPGTNIFNGLSQCGNSNPTVPGVSPGTTGCMKNKWMNPGPRLGFAYDPFGDGKWAIRGGYGIFFEHMNGNEANAELLEGNVNPLAVNGTVYNVTGYSNVAGSAGPSGPPSPFSVISIPNQVQWPYMQQWNFGIEHQLPSNIMLSVAYVGSKGTHLTRQFDANQLTEVPASQNPYIAAGLPITAADCPSDMSNFTLDSTGLPISAIISNGATISGQAVQNLFVACGYGATNYFRKYQGVGSVTRVENSANSIYNSLQVALRRSLGDLTLSASYTYSHSIDDSSDRYDLVFTYPGDFGLSRGSSNFDVRQAFTLSYVYALPLFKKPGALHTALGGWQISGISTALSGLPFTVTNGTTYSDNAGLGQGVGSVASYPDLVGNPNAVTPAEQAAYAAAGVFGVLKYNPAAYALPVGLTFGTATRNELRLPGRFNNDFGLFKRFQFRERYAFEFRWENFNVFNHTQLDQVNGNAAAFGTGANVGMPCVGGPNYNAGAPSCTSDGFLVLNASHNPRIMQFGLRFQF